MFPDRAVFGISVIAVIVSAWLFHEVNPGFEIICFWTGLPYLAHCALSIGVSGYQAASRAVVIGTVVSTCAADYMYFRDVWPFIDARSSGTHLMNCAGPLVELGVPILQWIFVGFLWSIAMLIRSREKGRWHGAGEWDRNNQEDS